MSSIVGRTSERLAPIPRLSMEISVNRSFSPSICGFQPFPVTPTPWISTTGGPLPSRV